MPNFVTSGDGPSKVALPLVPMIAVAFQLLIFFLLNLKIVAPEESLQAHMPLGAPPTAKPGHLQISDIKVRLQADSAGNLAQVLLGDSRLGNDDRAFDQLNGEILKLIGRPGAAMAKDVEVEIDADCNLRYEYVMKAVSTCTGRLDSNGNVIRYVEKVKFAPPKKKANA